MLALATSHEQTFITKQLTPRSNTHDNACLSASKTDRLTDSKSFVSALLADKSGIRSQAVALHHCIPACQHRLLRL
jgi:hypothetical protein